MTIQGLDELLSDISAMAEALSDNGQATTKALNAGADVILDDIKRRASTDPKIRSGDLYASIKKGRVKSSRKNGGKKIDVGVKHSERSAYYANPVEWGHGGPAPAPAHPFVVPAFDTHQDEAYDVIKNVLGSEIDQSWR